MADFSSTRNPIDILKYTETTSATGNPVDILFKFTEIIYFILKFLYKNHQKFKLRFILLYILDIIFK